MRVLTSFGVSLQQVDRLCVCELGEVAVNHILQPRPKTLFALRVLELEVSEVIRAFCKSILRAELNVILLYLYVHVQSL